METGEVQLLFAFACDETGPEYVQGRPCSDAVQIGSLDKLNKSAEVISVRSCNNEPFLYMFVPIAEAL